MDSGSDEVLNALSIDVEDYFQVSAFEDVIARADWDAWPARVEMATHRLMDEFDRAGIRATFFTLGWVAERFPGLIHRIVRDGHELACHGYDHVRLTQHTRESFREDLTKSRDILEDIGSCRLLGYRAASFSINEANTWAFEEIEAAGFRYSSSVYPVRHDLYGIPDAPRTPYRPDNARSLVEIPVATVRLLGRNLPAGGGGFFRLYPYFLTRYLIRMVHAQEVERANMYFHPWEFDPDQPRPQGLGLRSTFRHYLNQNIALDRLRRLMGDFRWAPFREVYSGALSGR